MTDIAKIAQAYADQIVKCETDDGDVYLMTLPRLASEKHFDEVMGLLGAKKVEWLGVRWIEHA